jgi:uncharacterized membrane-anchored protein
VYYFKGYVSDEDVISTDYDEIVQQVRESYYDREQVDSAWGAYGEYRHVLGWTIPPAQNYYNGSMTWSLHIAEGNLSNYSVPIHFVSLGRHGYLRLYMRGLISRHEVNSAIMRKAGQSISFLKDFRHGDRFVGKDPEPVMTIGKMVAESVTARLATPLTWKEYFSAVSYGLWKLSIHYAIELLAFFTIAIVFILISGLKRSFFAQDFDENDRGDCDFEEDDAGDEICKFGEASPRFAETVRKPILEATLNGVRLDRAR